MNGSADDEPLSSALTRILAPLGMSYVIRDECVILVTGRYDDQCDLAGTPYPRWVIGSFAGHRFIWKYNASQMQIVSCIASGTRK